MTERTASDADAAKTSAETIKALCDKYAAILQLDALQLAPVVLAGYQAGLLDGQRVAMAAIREVCGGH